MRLHRKIVLAALAPVVFTLTAATVLAQQPALKGDPAEAYKKIAMCEGCHGIPGYKTAYPVVYHVPKLGGQTDSYLRSALNAYKSGERNHPSMRGIAASLTDKDIADLAAYYAATPAGGHK